MKIVREGDANGHFEAPVAVRYKVAFIPTRAGAKSLELVRSFTLAPAPNATWGPVVESKSFSRQPTLLVDTDGDRIPDTYLPKTSGNFQVGWNPASARAMAERRSLNKLVQQYQVYDCSPPDSDPQCHPESQGIHCSQPCYPY
jgi:hypothetical protein